MTLLTVCFSKSTRDGGWRTVRVPKKENREEKQQGGQAYGQTKSALLFVCDHQLGWPYGISAFPMVFASVPNQMLRVFGSNTMFRIDPPPLGILVTLNMVSVFGSKPTN